MKSLITEKEKLRIRSMHINEKISLLKEDDGKFFDLLPIPPSTAEVASTRVTAGEPKTGTPDAIAFQKWVYDIKKDTSLSTSKFRNGQDGIFGAKSKAAWAKYKDEYTNTLSN